MARNDIFLSPRERMEKRYQSARMNLLLAIILTVVNVVLLLTGSDSMLLFSISVPFYAVIMGYAMESGVMLTTGCVIAAVMLAVYLVCWFFSKKHRGWLIAALVLFIVDTLVMGLMYLWLGDATGLLDALIHGLVIFYLSMGIYSAGKLKYMPEEEAEVDAVSAQQEDLPQFSQPLRRAAEDVKHRVLLETTYGGRQIVYRRVKQVNELVISGYVYDEYEARIERAHCLSARIDGHTIEMGYDETGFSYCKVDGQMQKKKIRLF